VARQRYRGQKQIWYLLRLTGRDSDLNLRADAKPEFDAWRWNDYWVDLDGVIEFKRDVYRRALNDERFLHQGKPYTRRRHGPAMHSPPEGYQLPLTRSQSRSRPGSRRLTSGPTQWTEMKKAAIAAFSALVRRVAGPLYERA
jgi:hypothetical protein